MMTEVKTTEDVAYRRAQLADRGTHSVPCPCQECTNESRQMGDGSPRSSEDPLAHPSSASLGTELGTEALGRRQPSVSIDDEI